MRTCIVISVIIHAALMLWLVFAPSAKTFDPANAEPIMVDLVLPKDLPQETGREPPKSEEPKPTDAKSEQAKSELPRSAALKPPKPELAKPQPEKPQPDKPGPAASQKPAPKSNSKTADDSLEDRAATAARLAWMLNLPVETAASLAAPPSESKSNLTSEEIAALKAQVSRCWVVPPDVPSTPGFDVLLRIALRPDGTLGAPPELIRAPASLAGPPLVDSAKRTLQKCQPYGPLPADKYQDWKILDLSFTAQGLSGLSGPPEGKNAAPR
jgi:hypothetical protein